MAFDPIIFSTQPILTPRQRILAHIALIAAKHEIHVTDIMSKSRTRKVVRARNEAIRWFYRNKQKEYSIADMGRFFNMDHSSCLYILGRLATRGPHDMREEDRVKGVVRRPNRRHKSAALGSKHTLSLEFGCFCSLVPGKE